MAKADGHGATVFPYAQTNRGARAQRDRRGTSDEVVCVLAHAFGFESAADYGRANEATTLLPRLRAQQQAARAARRARALAKANAFL